MSRNQYRDEIIKQLETEVGIDSEQKNKIITRLSKASDDELERTCDAFNRFGVQVILDIVKPAWK